MTSSNSTESPAPAAAATPPDSPPQKAAASTEDKLLEDAQSAFEQGDYKVAAELAKKLQGSAQVEVAQAAQALLLRTQTPALTKYLLFLSFVLLAFVTLAAYRH